jgi:peroxiredoxin
MQQSLKMMNSAYFSMKMPPVAWLVPVMIVCSLQGFSCMGSSRTAEGEVVIHGILAQCGSDSIRLYQVDGTRTKRIAAAKLEKSDNNHSFSISVKLPRPGFYMIGDDPRRSGSILLGEGGSYELAGDCQKPQAYKLSGSLVNDTYNQLQVRVNQYNRQIQGLYQNLQIFSQADPTQVQRIQADIQNLNNGHYGYLDSLEKAGGFISKVVRMYNFKPYMSDPSHSQYRNELEYFMQAFFANLDLNDPELAGLPQVYDKAMAYAATLADQAIPTDAIQGATDALLGKTKAGSVGHESLLRGYVVGFGQSKSPLTVTYGKLFLATYPDADPQFIATLNATISQMEAMLDGATAPEISASTPDGKTMKLSDFRGKIVMIDFWASWCRPCRMENPNVLKVYNQYHSKGFEILGVSLDQDKSKWVAAIQQDGLVWNHISDLGGWQSRPAAVYGVSSIPATVLVDKEGKIIARNLRGPALEAKLMEVFGN